MAAYTGRDFIAEFVISSSTDEPASGWKRLGALRSKGFETNWDTTDVTADDSDQYTNEELVTFKTTNFTFDGISRSEEIKNQDELEDYVNNYDNVVNFQPYVWWRLTRPAEVSGSTSKVYTFRALVPGFSIDAPYDGGVTFSGEARANTGVAREYV